MTTIRRPPLARPGERAFTEATEVFNLAAPARPAAAITARTIDDVRAALRHARAEGLPVRVHTTGHGAGGVRPVDGGLLIHTRVDGGVEVDAARRRARIPAGTRWGAVVEATAPHGLTAAHGSSATVGVVGYLLGGGMSFYGRRHGLAANTVVALDLVTAEGEHLRVDAATDPDLFWAIRGGGGGFGVVTAVEIALFPVAAVITGAAYWPAAHAERLLSRWREWSATAPWEVTTSVRVMNLPPVPDVPPELATGPMLCVDGAVLSDTADLATATRQADELLGPLREIAAPVLDTWRPGPAAAVLDAHMDPAQPMPVVGDHLLLGDLDADGAETLLRVLGDGSPLIAAGLRQLGGAYAVSAPDGGVLDRLDAAFSYAGSGVPMGPVTAEELRGHCALVREALRPWDTGRTVPCFVEDFTRPQGHLSAEQVRAVDAVRARVDPDGLFHGDIAPHATARTLN
ncbi:FAD-binding oxidoreductase [Actinokineospora diospyrosa]|uniref:FAD/FMN-containing dehydrogenase n=1 Tax=Actinokineospora diospyrosa TaxID=103728 RepID=A0ABT1IE69_9PSEU|nr:FAD-dependent oxidoreductase [Actinokineospora diospyrosa]MCP2270941.1 FAD/FMN-containing dehydrogenase [Actinokineospora diospyrosa]